MGFSPPSLGESEDDTPVLFALVLDLRHRHPADLGSVADMSAAAGLQIDPDISIRRTRPMPLGGLTDIVRTSSGLAASSSSVIQRGPTGYASAISALSRVAIASLSRLEPGTSKSSRPLPSETWPPVTAPGTTLHNKCRHVCMRISRC